MAEAPLPRPSGDEMRELIAGIAAAGASALVLLGGGLADSTQLGRQAQPAGDQAAPQVLDGFSPGDTAAYVAQLEARVEKDGAEGETLTLLGVAYQQLARETGDPSFYPRSYRALREALALEPTNALTFRGLASLAASRHRFGESLELARRAREYEPLNAAVFGLLGDAYLELGRYRRAFAAFDRMAAIKPGTLAYARVSYARELLGNTGGAIAAMRMAVSAAGSDGEAAAWANAQLGNLHLNSGRLVLATVAFRRALRAFPMYAPAYAGLAQAAWWRGRHEQAARLFTVALDQAPVPEYAVALGDVYGALGRTADAEAAYAKAEALEGAFAANGGRNQLETALFDLDHDRNVADALRRARIGHGLRPSIEGEHVLAWALYKNGRCEAARKHSERALRLGTKDTGAMLHRSYIERCLGNEAAAREFRRAALAANPYALMTVGSPRIHVD
jgi:tetratricopeptide (TPR) repeat protein